MSEQNGSLSERPSLRVAELSIENFRSFGARTVIPFSGGAGAADAIATVHGDNGSGKSNAIAALHFFLRTARFLLQTNASPDTEFAWDRPYTPSRGIYTIRRRDRRSDAEGPTEIGARFADERLGSLTIRVRPTGSALRLEWEGSAAAWRERKTSEYRSWLETPFGPESRPMAVINANRRASWLVNQPPSEVAPVGLLEELHEAWLSRDPKRRARWHDLASAIRAVPAFAGRELLIGRPQKNGDPELTFEEPGKSILGLEELSSGERQLVVLFASVLLADAAIVAIEEPELSLDAKNQRLFYDFLGQLVQKRRIDQAIIESHVAAFDGPDVIRFQRDPGGSTQVSREPIAGPEARQLGERARAQGAKPRWVTSDGFTQLPEAMREELTVGAGKHLWFLRGPEHWEAWPEDDLDQMLGGASETGDG